MNCVYVIEDDRPVAKSLLIMLEALGISVVHFETADDFLLELNHLPEGCVVLDINLPGTDGLTALSVMRGWGVTWPVLMMTGVSTPEIVAKARKLRALTVLEKPFSTADFIGQVRRAVACSECRLTNAAEVATAGKVFRIAPLMVMRLSASCLGNTISACS